MIIYHFYKNRKIMYNRSHILLACLSFFIIYLFYKIVFFKIEEFKIRNFSATIENRNAEVKNRIAKKEELEKYISTNAYRTQIAKATQNKNLPGEQIINVISQEDVDGNANKETQEVLANIAENSENNPTINMTNPERWHYIFKTGLNKK